MDEFSNANRRRIGYHYLFQTQQQSSQLLQPSAPRRLALSNLKKITTEKPGDWQVSILQELPDTDLDSGTLLCSMVEASQ